MVSTRLCKQLLTAWIMLFGIACAQPKFLTLNQAKETALARNITVAQAENNIDAAQASVLAAKGNYLPTLSASGAWNGGQTNGIAATNKVTSGLELDYTVFDGLAREGKMKSASAEATATEYTAVRTRQTIAYQVERSYLDFLRDEQIVKVGDENLKRNQRQLEKITTSHRAGGASLADVYRQESQVASDELTLIKAQNTCSKAKADLISLIGLEDADNYVIADTSIISDIDTSESNTSPADQHMFTELTNVAIEQRRDYKAAIESYDATDARVTSALSGYMPSLSTSVGYNLAGSGFSNLGGTKALNWQVTLKWSLFDGFSRNESVQSARVDRQNASLRVQQSRRDIGVEVRKALLDLGAARKQYAVSRTGLQSAAENRKIAEEKYNLGVATLLDLQTANASLVEADVNRVNALYDYVIAERNVQYACGLMAAE